MNLSAAAAEFFNMVTAKKMRKNKGWNETVDQIEEMRVDILQEIPNTQAK